MNEFSRMLRLTKSSSVKQKVKALEFWGTGSMVILGSWRLADWKSLNGHPSTSIMSLSYQLVQLISVMDPSKNMLIVHGNSHIRAKSDPLKMSLEKKKSEGPTFCQGILSQSVPQTLGKGVWSQIPNLFNRGISRNQQAKFKRTLLADF